MPLMDNSGLAALQEADGIWERAVHSGRRGRWQDVYFYPCPVDSVGVDCSTVAVETLPT